MSSSNVEEANGANQCDQIGLRLKSIGDIPILFLCQFAQILRF